MWTATKVREETSHPHYVWWGWSAVAHLDAVADIIQEVVVNGLPDVPDRPLHVCRGDDLMSPWRVFVCGEDADLPPGHLLFVDVHCLQGDRTVMRTERRCWTSERLKWEEAFRKEACGTLTMLRRDRRYDGFAKATIVRRHNANPLGSRVCQFVQRQK